MYIIFLITAYMAVFLITVFITVRVMTHYNKKINDAINQQDTELAKRLNHKKLIISLLTLLPIALFTTWMMLVWLSFF